MYRFSAEITERLASAVAAIAPGSAVCGWFTRSTPNGKNKNGE